MAVACVGGGAVNDGGGGNIGGVDGAGDQTRGGIDGYASRRIGRAAAGGAADGRLECDVVTVV